eukprot:TRINITY_DN6530_c0_g1_i3.p1 TRINITY_DN6530_c0_g1~~TRINITY_DN6530_c0_g1_i3.p1  ORF type:complete len:455 (+),score=17.78 TRINITY_DN6530_c0_g1_i3:109-1365(+)
MVNLDYLSLVRGQQAGKKLFKCLHTRQQGYTRLTNFRKTQRNYQQFKYRERQVVACLYTRSQINNVLSSQAQDQVNMTSPPRPPIPSPEYPAWTKSEGASPFNQARKVFCNRSLNMNSIQAIGFDMDYTLAQYKPETFETLAYYSTVEKLVKEFGYPEELTQFRFDWRYMTRGLTIDKKRGNILKIDRHKYVKLAYHGFAPLTKDERMVLYCQSEVRESFEEPDFCMIDTLFSLAEAYLFMQLVELKDSSPKQQLLQSKSYMDMYRDARAAVDLCHRDGTLKREVAENPSKYIYEDPQLAELLTMLRDSGRSLFLATNSLWDYTNVVMNYLITETKGSARSDQWLEYFDVVVTGCNKPAFFTQKKSLFQVCMYLRFLIYKRQQIFRSQGAAVTRFLEQVYYKQFFLRVERSYFPFHLI